ncbi:MAG: recombination-associated protein RdgC [Rhodocyclaceae bacterium]|nr:recombination-associated protein RdgC [Rhodocyclaceae bacterium]
MWFRNLQVFRLTPDWSFSADVLAEKLTTGIFQPCGATDRVARGWVPPRGQEGELVLAAGPQHIFALGTEAKLLPASVVRQYADTRLQELEKSQGYRPGRKQARDVRDEIELSLLPRAFVKRTLTYVWVDPVNRWLVVDASSSTRADDIIEQLKLTLGELPLTLLKTRMAPGTAITQWLAAGEAPGRFTIDRDCELQAIADERPVVRYVRHNLDSDEVRAHIAAGKTATRLSLTWNDRVALILTEQLQIKRVAFLDLVKEEAERQAESGDELFAANFALMAGELGLLLNDIVLALGGEGE